MFVGMLTAIPIVIATFGPWMVMTRDWSQNGRFAALAAFCAGVLVVRQSWPPPRPPALAACDDVDDRF
jgi:hypothetical protein